MVMRRLPVPLTSLERAPQGIRNPESGSDMESAAATFALGAVTLAGNGAVEGDDSEKEGAMPLLRLS